jgi:hypothetical protein
VQRTESLLADWWFSVVACCWPPSSPSSGQDIAVAGGQSAMAIGAGFHHYFVERQLAFACANVVVTAHSLVLVRGRVRRLA